MDHLKLLSAKFRIPVLDRCASKLKLAAFATAIFSSKKALWPGLQYPRVPGHEIAGRIDAIGIGVIGWKQGPAGRRRLARRTLFRYCEHCRRGDFVMCVNRKFTGIEFDGGYAEYMIAPAAALAAIPEELPAEEAGPFMCAGVTVLQRASQFGCARAAMWWPCTASAGWDISEFSTRGRWDFKTVAIGRGKDKEPLAKKLGAHHYIDSGRRRCGGGIAKAGRRDGDSGDRAERKGDFRARGWIVGERQADGRRPRLTNR